MLNPIPFTKVRISDPLWQKKIELVRSVVLPYQWEILNDRVEGAQKSFCIRNFLAAAGKINSPHSGVVFLDSDLYKWLEALAYTLVIEKDKKLEALADKAIELIVQAQQPDGYLNTFYTLLKPDRRYTNLMEGHELYCAGHMIEAAVAYVQATGKDRLLIAALKLARHLSDFFMPKKVFPGHPEVELALIKLYEYTGERFCLELAQHFIDVRGQEPKQMMLERNDPQHDWIWEDMKRFDDEYFQAHEPVRQQTTAEGHAVRAMYLYSAMADLARISDEKALCAACAKLIDSVGKRRMYVTGGIGSSAFGERFTSDWDLPNDTMYCETCASIGLMLFSRRMTLLTCDVSYYDLWERALTNTVLAGLGEDGKHFFYVNPLEVRPETIKKNMTLAHVKPVRQSWFGVACCPPNIARTLSSLAGSIYARQKDVLYVLAHIASEFEDEGQQVKLSREGENYRLSLSGAAAEIRLRIPEGFDLTAPETAIEKGCLILRHPGGEAVYEYRLTPRLRLVRANPRVTSDSGKACLMRGMNVYCMEEKDNGSGLSSLYLPENAAMTEEYSDSFGGLPVIKIKGLRMTDSAWGDSLYTQQPPWYEERILTFIPYSCWGNRGKGEMSVWINQLPSSKTAPAKNE